MSFSRADARATAITVAQDAIDKAQGVQLLLKSPEDYDQAIVQAVARYTYDRPRETKVHHTVTAPVSFRFVLFGTGVITEMATGADTWDRLFSQLTAVWVPYDTAVQSNRPIDDNRWRTLEEPGPIVLLEFLDLTPSAAQVLRLEFTKQHSLTDAPDTVAKPAAPTAALVIPAVPGNCDNGTHSVRATYVTAQGETEQSDASSQVTVADKSVNGKVAVSIADSPSPGVTAKRAYMTVAGDAGDHKLAGEIPNGSSDEITLNVADSSLGTDAPTVNTAGGNNTIPDTDEAAFTLLSASMILQMAAINAVKNLGNTGLPNDVVDRRTPADIMRTLAKDLATRYGQLVGTTASGIKPASALIDFDLKPSHRLPYLWHGEARR